MKASGAEHELLPILVDDGWTIHLERFATPPTVAPRAAIVMGPAMMVGRRSLDRPPGRGMASFFANAGHAVYTLDLRGHGASEPRASASVDWSYRQIVSIDLPAAIRAVKALHPTLPLALIGPSLCGHAGAAALGCDPSLAVDALVMLGANIWLPQLEPSRPLRLLKLATLLSWKAIADHRGYFPARALRLGTNDEARTYVGEFLRWMRVDRWGDRRVDYLERLGHVRVPTLQINARGDRLLCRTPCARRFVERMTRAAVTFWEIGAKDLDSPSDGDPGHMTVVVDPRSRPVWARIDRWIGDTLHQAKSR